MVSTPTPDCDFGRPAPDFDLPDPDGCRWTLDNCRGPAGTLVVFMCNHCPYVRAIIERLCRDARELRGHGVHTVAIMPNDVDTYPEDAPEHMAAWARELDFPFPYLYDETQSVARAYGAVCTPDFFGYDAGLGLQYRGRLDASGKQPAAPDADRELFEAMRRVVRGEGGPAAQTPSIGCSIKWRA